MRSINLSLATLSLEKFKLHYTLKTTLLKSQLTGTIFKIDSVYSFYSLPSLFQFAYIKIISVVHTETGNQIFVQFWVIFANFHTEKYICKYTYYYFLRNIFASQHFSVGRTHYYSIFLRPNNHLQEH